MLFFIPNLTVWGLRGESTIKSVSGNLPLNLFPFPVYRWETPHPLSLLLCEEQREEFTGWKFFFPLCDCRVEVYKRLRSQVRGSQRRLCRCLRSVLKAVLVPCTYEHNIISYIIFPLCEDVFYLQIKSTGNRLAHSKVDGYVTPCSAANLTEITSLKALII